MAVNKAYKLIIRPFISENPSNFNYIRDKSGLTTFRGYIRAFEIFEKDLVELFDYIEPSDENRNTYSHRIFEMYLRACTEFEANAKNILNNNTYNKQCYYNIEDYYKLNKAMKLSDYIVKVSIWEGVYANVKPFEEWNAGSTLKWYQDYNMVKHNRNNNFHLASLENLVKAISAVRIILYAQYDFISFNSSHDIDSFSSTTDGFICRDESIFSIKFNGTWSDNEKYDFDWETLSQCSEKYQKYNFN